MFTDSTIIGSLPGRIRLFLSIDADDGQNSHKKDKCLETAKKLFPNKLKLRLLPRKNVFLIKNINKLIY